MKQLILSLLLLVAGNLFSQSIKGEVSNEENSPIEYASVRLLWLSDSTVITGAYTDSLGVFNFDFPKVNSEKKHRFLIKISYALHESYVKEIVGPVNLGAIILKLDKTINIEEVTASGSLDVLKAGIDKKVYLVEEDISVRGGTANDVLNNIPSIDVDQDGNISLRGDANVTILIDGRPSTLVGNDGANVLDAFPANAIERIEVVTNPSAKYDPDGTSGIINIVLKKNKLKGFNGIASITAATDNLYDGNLGLSYRNSKFNINLNYSFNYYEGYRNYYNDLTREVIQDSSTQLFQSREGADLKSTNTLVLGTEFYLNKRNVLGLSVTGVLGERTRRGNLESSLYNNIGGLESRWDRNSEDPRKRKNLDFNLNFTHKLKDQKGEWSFNANHSQSMKEIKGFYEELYYDNLGQLSSLSPLNQQLSNDTKELVTTLQSDFSKIFEKQKVRIELGAKAILRNDDLSTFSETKDTLTGLFLEDTIANFDYQYDESIYSLYGTFGQELGKLKYQVGLRGEYAEQTPNLISTNEKFINTYLNLFPSAHIKYSLSKKTEVSLSYSKRINRAKSRQLNPFTSYANPVNLRSGNPELQPEYIHSFDLGASYNAKKIIFSTSVFHRRTNDVITRIKVYNPDNTAKVTYQNIDKSISTGLEVVFIYKPFKWLKNTLSFNGNFIDYISRDTTLEFTNSGFNWSGKYIMSVDFWKNTASFQINANYNAPRVAPQGIIQIRTGIDLSVEKRLLDKRLSIGMRVTDIFDTKGFDLNLSQTGVSQTSEFKWRTRRFYLTLSYRWGNLDGKNKLSRKSSGGGMD
tara:strand:+ start:8370 stop:10787 length:2418 start_codon:yes stop_codon:yes gene_type:complete